MRIYQRRAGGVWWYEFECDGRRHRATTREKSKTRAREAAESARLAARRGETPERDRVFARPVIAELVADYAEELLRRGRAKKYIRDVAATLAYLFNHAGIGYLDELDSPAVERGLGHYAGQSPRTRNKALGTVRGFCRWLHRTGRAASNPAEHVERARHSATHEPRRALTPDEIEALVTCPEIHDSRRLVYLVAIHTGLRRAELGGLSAENVDLGRREINLDASMTKNRKAATLPISLRLAKEWQCWLEEPRIKSRQGESLTPRILPPPPQKRTFYEDAARAGLIARDREGAPIHEDARGRLDFHALRVTFVTSLARAGVPLALAQKLARHSDPALTANIYTRFAGCDTREAVERLDEFLAESTQKPTQKRNNKPRTA